MMHSERERLGNTYKGPTRTNEQQLTDAKNQGYAPGSSLSTQIAVSDIRMIAQNENQNGRMAVLTGHKAILTESAESRCKDFQESPDSGGFSNPPSEKLRVLTQAECPKTAYSGAVLAEYRGSKQGGNKSVRISQHPILQGSTGTVLQGGAQ